MKPIAAVGIFFLVGIQLCFFFITKNSKLLYFFLKNWQVLNRGKKKQGDFFFLGVSNYTIFLENYVNQNQQRSSQVFKLFSLQN